MLKQVESPWIERLDIPGVEVEKAVEAGLVAAVSELCVDAGNGFTVGNLESGEILGEVSPLRFVGEEIAEVIECLLYDLWKRDDAGHGNASQHKGRHALVYSRSRPVPRCLNFAKVQV